MKKIENNQEFEDIIQKGGIVIADFYADWCGPCQMQLPILEDLSKDLEGKVDIIKINVDHQQELMERFGVRSIPTIIFFKNQKVMDTTVGLQNKDELQKRVSALEMENS